jgi:hypothetical protein
MLKETTVAVATLGVDPAAAVFKEGLAGGTQAPSIAVVPLPNS